MNHHLHLDFESFSLVDLSEVGLANYSCHASTGVNMLGWALDDEEVQIWLPHIEPMQERLLKLLADPDVTLFAWNVSFEYNIFKHVLKLDLPIARWRDPSILAHNLSLPGKLSKVGAILKMAEQKDPRGEELVKMFCQPVSHGGEMTLFGIAPPLFRDHNSHPREFAEYISYCKQDVVSERALWHKLSKIGFPEHEWQGWLLNHKINEYGIPVRRDLAEKGLRLAQRYIKEQRDICKTLTGLENPNSDTQMKEWARERGYARNSLLAGTVATELKNPDSKMTPECKQALIARGKARKSSWTKIETLLSLLSEDDRLRYQFRYMGAARTGRWASGGGEDASVQVQNMARGVKAVKKKLELALRLLDAEDYDGIIAEFTNTKDPKDSITVVDFVITLLRSLFQAKPGKKFLVSDKNAIENRMLGWASGCEAILDVFRKGRDPYMAFGVHLYGIPYEEWYTVDAQGNHKPKNAEFEEKRQNSKPPVLGGGYCLGGGELYIDEHGDEKRGGLWGYALNVCGVDMPKDLAHKAIKILRDAWPEVVQFWTDLEEAFKQVFKYGGVIKVGEVTWKCPPPTEDDPNPAKAWVEHPTKGKGCVITFRRIKMGEGDYAIRAELPSGRALHYLNVSIEEEKKVSTKTGKPYTAHTIYYGGIEHSATQAADGSRAKKQHSWGRVKTYGGKLCLSGATLVITPNGLKRLDEIILDDLVWDGVEWVQHTGLICNGLRETQTWMGLTGTPDHQILDGNEWHELGKTTNLNGLCSLLTGLASAIRLWCSLNRENMAEAECGATADKSLTWIHERFVEIKLLTVPHVAAKRGRPTEQNDSGITSSLIESCGIFGYENFPTLSLAVTIQSAEPTVTTEGAELNAMSRGEKAAVSGLNMPSLFQDGITLLLTLIELTTMEIMSREISASSLAKKIQIINELLSGLPWTANSSHMKCFGNDILRIGAKTLSIIISNADAPLNGVSTATNKQKVYDLQNCGPRRRFMVMTYGGPVLVHNCENFIQAMSRDDLLNSMFLADEMGFNIFGLFHDEIATEVDDTWDGLTLADLNWCMVQTPSWAKGLMLGAEGYESQVYKKT